MSNIVPYGTVKAHELLWRVGVRDRRTLERSVLGEGLEELWNRIRRERPIDSKLEKAVGAGWLLSDYVTDARMDEHPSKEFPILYYYGNRDLLNEELIGIIYQRPPRNPSTKRNQLALSSNMPKKDRIEFKRAWISHSLDKDSVNIVVLDEDTSYLLGGVAFSPKQMVGIMPHGFSASPGQRNNQRLRYFREVIKSQGLVISPYPVTAGSTTQNEGYLLMPELSDKINVVNMERNYPARHAVEQFKKPIKYFRS